MARATRRAAEQAVLNLLDRAGLLGLLARAGLLDGTVDKIARDSLQYVPFTQLANLTGTPAMSVPLHWTADGLPLGVQFVARFGEEDRLLQLAAQLETAQPWFGRLPGLGDAGLAVRGVQDAEGVRSKRIAIGSKMERCAGVASRAAHGHSTFKRNQQAPPRVVDDAPLQGPLAFKPGVFGAPVVVPVPIPVVVPGVAPETPPGAVVPGEATPGDAPALAPEELPPAVPDAAPPAPPAPPPPAANAQLEDTASAAAITIVAIFMASISLFTMEG